MKKNLASRLVTCVALASLAALSAASKDELSPNAMKVATRQVTEIGHWKDHLSLVQRKIDSGLLFAIWNARGKRLTKSIRYLDPEIAIDNRGMVQVRVRGNIGPGLVAKMQGFGAEIEKTWPEYGSLYAKVPLLRLENIASLSSVIVITQPDVAITQTESQGVKTHKVDSLWNQWGLTGKGVKVGVISDSVDFLAASQAAGELPAVTVLSGQAGSGTGEGTAMLEIVHDMAPDAALYFATAKYSQEQFATNIKALYAAGCDVIVDDIIYPSEGVFQDGIVARAVNEVTLNGAMYFSSAGNYGNFDSVSSSVWEGDFSGNGGSTETGEVNYWNSATINLNKITSKGALVGLSWSDPLEHSSNDYDLYVTDGSGNILKASANLQTGTQNPYETCPSVTGGYLLVIRRFSAQARALHVDVFGGKLARYTNGQTFGHSAAMNSFSVSAAEAANIWPNSFSTSSPVEAFTSDGPRRIFFNADGTPVTPGNFLFATGGWEARLKPDITAADGVHTSVPGFDPFHGTSAAAPHAAAISALILQARPATTRYAMMDIFTTGAWHLGAPGWNRNAGIGILNARESGDYAIASGTRLTPSLTTIPFGAAFTLTLSIPAALPVDVSWSLDYNSSSLSIPSTTIILHAGETSYTMSCKIDPVGPSGENITIKAFLDGSVTPYFASTTIKTEGSVGLSKLVQDVSSIPAGQIVNLSPYLNALTAVTRLITLTSSNAAIFPLPASLSILAGTDHRFIQSRTKWVSVDTDVTWSATYLGTTLTSTPITIKAGYLANCTITPTSVTGGKGASGKVTVSTPAPPGGLTVTLRSGDPSVVGVPVSVAISEGATTATFPITTSPVSVVKGYGITAKLGTVLLKPILKVYPPKVLSLSISPNPIKGGLTATGVITLDGPAPPFGFEITLVSNSALVTVPGTVIVSGGYSSVSFDIPTGVVRGKTITTVTASVTGSPSKSKNLVLLNH